METPRQSAKKPQLTEEGLKEHGVEYDPKVLKPDDPLPSHVDLVRDFLLSFEDKIHIDCRAHLESDLSSIVDSPHGDESTKPKDEYSALPDDESVYWRLSTFPDHDKRKQSEELKDTIASSSNVTDEFKNLKNEAETSWTSTLRAEIFQKYRHAAPNRRGKL